MTFDSFELHPRLLSNVAALGYVSPTPIQAQAIPVVAQGRDVMGLAQTGTGKTAAFLLPILHQLLTRPEGPRRGVSALIIAPTRELAEQISDSARDLSRGTKIRATTVYGGVGLNPQIKALREGVDIVVACPGRLLDLIQQGHAAFPALRTLVLDEADHMFDMGFLPTIRKILKVLPAERQTLLFSATMPEEIKGLALDILRDPATVRIGRVAPAETVTQALYPVDAGRKAALLLELLGRAQDGSVLVFTRTKHRAKRLAEQLCKCGHKASCLQGNLSQNRRQEALNGFRDGVYRIMVATDIAARGIDISKVAHVVNYDVPDTAEAYTHRIGRTGRAERTGAAYTFVTGEDGFMVRAIERLLGSSLPRLTLEGFDYNGPKLEVEIPLSERFPPRGGQRRPAPRAASGRDAGRDGQARSGGRPTGSGGARPEGGPGVRLGGRPDSRADSRADARPGGRVDSRPASRADGLRDSRPGGRLDGRVAGRPDDRREAHGAPRPGGRFESPADGQPGRRSGGRPEARPGERNAARSNHPQDDDFGNRAEYWEKKGGAQAEAWHSGQTDSRFTPRAAPRYENRNAQADQPRRRTFLDAAPDGHGHRR